MRKRKRLTQKEAVDRSITDAATRKYTGNGSLKHRPFEGLAQWKSVTIGK